MSAWQKFCTRLGARAFLVACAKGRLRMVMACTGNLLAPWAAATATGVLRSAYSRVQLPRLRKRRMELLGKLKVCAHVTCLFPHLWTTALRSSQGPSSHAKCC